MQYLTAGESHGPMLTGIITGLPAGLKVDEEKINHNLARRQAGAGRGGRMKIEQDQIQMNAGVRAGYTLGSPVALQINNHDYANWQHVMGKTPDEKIASKRVVTAPRPGHADLVGGFKYQHRDLRNVLERSSARETAMRVAIGSLCQQLLQQLGIDVLGVVTQIGKVKSKTASVENEEELSAYRQVSDESPVRMLDQTATDLALVAIEQAKKEGYSLGGKVQVIATGLPAGLGSYIADFTKLDGKLAQAILSINAFKGVSFGDGESLTEQPGNAVMDEINWSKKAGFGRVSNHLGGLEGGMTTGEPLVVNGIMKPIPTQLKPLNTVAIDTKEKVLASVERSDTTAVPAAAVVAESTIAITLCQVILDQFNSDSMDRLKKEIEQFRIDWQAY